MRKIILFVIAALMWVPGFSASSFRQEEKRSIRLTGVEVIREGDRVRILFDLHAGRKVTGNNNSLVVQPVLQKGGDRLPVIPIVIQGKRAAISSESRAEGERVWGNRPPYYTSNGKTVRYRTEIPYAEWMQDSELVLNGVSIGHDKTDEVRLGLIADHLLPEEPEKEPFIVELPLPEPTEEPVEMHTLSTGDRLAEKFTFVAPVSEFEKARLTSSGTLFDYNMPLILGKGVTTRAQGDVVDFINGTREGALGIRFRQGSRVISRETADNNRVLVDLISTVRAIEASDDSRVARIVITGFASPEGRLEENEKLAWDRAIAVKEFFTANSTIDESILHVYNGSVDWSGLRKLVAESGMLERLRVLEIIDNTPVWDSERNMGRHGELMRLSGGEPYRYMLQHFFPQLRQAAYIKVYYENL